MYSLKREIKKERYNKTYFLYKINLDMARLERVRIDRTLDYKKEKPCIPTIYFHKLHVNYVGGGLERRLRA